MKTIYLKPEHANMTPIVRKVLDDISWDEETVLAFEKGTYYFHREGSRLCDIFSSGGKSVKNYVVFPVQNKKGLTICGNGSEFVFCDRMQPFLFQNCKDILLKDFSMDYSFLRYAYGTVKDATEDGFTLLMDEDLFDYSVDGGNLCFHCGSDTLSTRYRKISCKRIMPKRSGIYFLYIGDTQAPAYAAAPNVRIDGEKTKGGVFFRYRDASPRVCFLPGDTVCLGYDNEREAQSFWFENCKEICLEDVSIYRGGGMGVVADVCEDIRIYRLRIQVKPGREEFYTTTADGIFLTNCKGVFELKDSLISKTYDDAMNIHGFYTFVEEVLPDNKVRVGYRHASHWGAVPFKTGDVLHISEPETFREAGTAKVVALDVSPDRERMVLTLDCAEPLAPGMLLENPDRMPNVLLENNVVENCPHIRVSARYMTVRNNQLNLNDNDLYINDLIGFWGESGAVEEVTICDNTFGNAAGGNILVKSFRPEDSNRLHNRIKIENNRFAQHKEKALRISGVRELDIVNNTYAGGAEND